MDSIKAIPFFSQFSDEQIRKQLQKDADGLRKMHARALKTGKKVNGFMAEDLEAMANRYDKMAEG